MFNYCAARSALAEAGMVLFEIRYTSAPGPQDQESFYPFKQERIRLHDGILSRAERALDELKQAVNQETELTYAELNGIRELLAEGGEETRNIFIRLLHWELPRHNSGDNKDLEQAAQFVHRIFNKLLMLPKPYQRDEWDWVDTVFPMAEHEGRIAD